MASVTSSLTYLIYFVYFFCGTIESVLKQIMLPEGKTAPKYEGVRILIRCKGREILFVICLLMASATSGLLVG